MLNMIRLNFLDMYSRRLLNALDVKHDLVLKYAFQI